MFPWPDPPIQRTIIFSPLLKIYSHLEGPEMYVVFKPQAVSPGQTVVWGDSMTQDPECTGSHSWTNSRLGGYWLRTQNGRKTSSESKLFYSFMALGYKSPETQFSVFLFLPPKFGSSLDIPVRLQGRKNNPFVWP